MRQRIQTGIIALIIFVPFLIYGDWPFALFVYLLATIALIELLKMYKIIKYSFPFLFAILFLWIILLPFGEINILTNPYVKIEAIILFVMLLLTYTVLSKNKFTFDNASFILLATMYVGMGFYFLIKIRMDGLHYILYALFVIWATDTGAYFTGKALGKKKLWPEISPNKTVGGAIGGIVIAVIIGTLFQVIHPFDFSLLTVVVVTILVSIVGQIGDLVASAFKRHYQIKDSGNILPGHGGILDRMDSLLFVLPFLHLINFVS